MKTQLIWTVITAYLCAAPAAFGQPQDTGTGAQGASGSSDITYIGHRIPLLRLGADPQGPNGNQETPQQKAWRHRVDALTTETARDLNAGQYADAEGLARKTLAIFPSDSFTKELLARSLSGQGRATEAIQAYRAVVNPKGDWSTGRFNEPRVALPYALQALQSGQWAEAVTAYEKALPALPGTAIGGVLPQINAHFDPHIPQPTMLEAAIRVALGINDNWECDSLREYHHDRALAEYQKALQLEPNWDLANFYYGYGLQRLGRKAEAKAPFAKAAAMGDDTMKKAVEQLSK